MKYFRAVAHAQPVSFAEKQVFLKLAIFSILKNKCILTKLTRFSESTAKVKVILSETLFLISLTSAVI